jgi:FeoB-associated Cys-rich membrane protein
MMQEMMVGILVAGAVFYLIKRGWMQWNKRNHQCGDGCKH